MNFSQRDLGTLSLWRKHVWHVIMTINLSHEMEVTQGNFQHVTDTSVGSVNEHMFLLCVQH